jgi:hypothetical protein
MIKAVEFSRFRGFARLKVELLPHAYIVGPNSAGKSTVLEALGLVEQCLRLARCKLPSLRIIDNKQSWRAYPIPSENEDSQDPVRFDFGNDEARVSVEWVNGARINIIWPEDTDEGQVAFFYLTQEDGGQPNSISSVKALFTQITVVPVITPLEKFEEIKTFAYIESQQSTRLASRHFRNNMFLMKNAGQYEYFREFCSIWLPEISLLEVAFNASANRLVVFYTDIGSRTPKELSWAGDGIQIWVQILWHVFRAQGALTVVLDEPEVYLHPDLQRRLVRLLDSLNAQIILASHSADVIAEAPPDGILWVDRRSFGARRARSQRVLSDLSASLGSSFNLALARSMRAQLVIASDCDDTRLISTIARHIGATSIANEHRVSLIQLRDVSRFTQNEGLGASLRSVLPTTLPAVLLLQSGHRSENHNASLVKKLTAPNITPIILPRPELENYLLDSETIAKASGAASSTVELKLSKIFDDLRESARRFFIAGRLEYAREGAAQEMVKDAEVEFDQRWANRDCRHQMTRAKDVIASLNIWLENEGYKVISGNSLAQAIKPQNIHTDIINAFYKIETLLSI